MPIREDPIIRTLDLGSFVVFKQAKNARPGMRLAPAWDGPECLRLCNDGPDCQRLLDGYCPFTHIRFGVQNEQSLAPAHVEDHLDTGSEDSSSSPDSTPTKRNRRRRRSRKSRQLAVHQQQHMAATAFPFGGKYVDFPMHQPYNNLLWLHSAPILLHSEVSHIWGYQSPSPENSPRELLSIHQKPSHTQPHPTRQAIGGASTTTTPEKPARRKRQGSNSKSTKHQERTPQKRGDRGTTPQKTGKGRELSRCPPPRVHTQLVLEFDSDDELNQNLFSHADSLFPHIVRSKSAPPQECASPQSPCDRLT